MKLSYHRAGFTLVELLIVIVVIAILAAITIVAYSGVQGRAYDSAVQTDLHNLYEQIGSYQTINGSLPLNFTTLGAKVDRSAYATSMNNLIFCSTSDFHYAVAAVSKSGKIFYTSDTNGTGTYTNTWTGAGASTCLNILAGTVSGFVWGYTNNAWQLP